MNTTRRAITAITALLFALILGAATAPAAHATNLVPDDMASQMPGRDNPAPEPEPTSDEPLSSELMEGLPGKGESQTTREGTGMSTEEIEAVDRTTFSIFEKITRSMAEAIEAMQTNVSTLITKAPEPLISPDEGPVAAVQAMMSPYATVLAVFSILWCSYRMLVTSIRINDWSAFSDFLGFIVKFTLGIYVLTSLLGMFQDASDLLAVGIIDRAVGSGQFGENMLTLVVATGPVGLGTMAVMYLVQIATAIPVLFLLTMKGFILIMLCGLMILSLAGSGIGAGRDAFSLHLQWILAFLLVEPAMAIVYSMGFTVMADQAILEGGLTSFIWGAGLHLMALFMLPAMIVMVGKFFSTTLDTRGIHSVARGGAATGMRFAATQFNKATGRHEAPANAANDGAYTGGKAAPQAASQAPKAPAPKAAPAPTAQAPAAGMANRATTTYTGASKAGAATAAAAPGVAPVLIAGKVVEQANQTAGKAGQAVKKAAHDAAKG